MNDEKEKNPEEQTDDAITETKNAPRRRVVDGRPFLKEALKNLPPRSKRRLPHK